MLTYPSASSMYKEFDYSASVSSDSPKSQLRSLVQSSAGASVSSLGSNTCSQGLLPMFLSMKRNLSLKVCGRGQPCPYLFKSFSNNACSSSESLTEIVITSLLNANTKYALILSLLKHLRLFYRISDCSFCVCEYLVYDIINMGLKISENQKRERWSSWEMNDSIY
jgi:hypothetical protein